jgi:GAF domain-containing protein
VLTGEVGGVNRELLDAAAVRRVAMLLAERAPQAAVIEAVTEELGVLLAPARTRIVRGERPDEPDGTVARIAREAGGPDRVAAVPIAVGGTTWGTLLAVPAAGEALADGAGALLADFARLLGGAVAGARADEELRSLTEQQAALRRVATLVAQQASPNAIFTAVAREVSQALGVPRVDVCRRDADGTLTLLGSATAPGRAMPHAVSKPAEHVAAKVVLTGRAARVDDWTARAGPDAQAAGEEGLGSVVGAPIFVEGEL